MNIKLWFSVVVLAVILAAAPSSAAVVRNAPQFGVQLQVYDASTNQRVHRGERVDPSHQYFVLVNFIGFFISGAGQYALTTASATGCPRIVQSDTATLNGTARRQFAYDDFEFRTSAR